MVIEAGMQPKVLGAVHAGPRPGRRRRSAPRGARHPEPPAEAPCGPRARWSAPTRARRSTCSPTARIPPRSRPGRRRPGALDRAWAPLGATWRITNLAVRRNYFGAFDSQAFFSVANFSGERQRFAHADRSTTGPGRADARRSTRRCGGPSCCRSASRAAGCVRARLDVSDDLDRRQRGLRGHPAAPGDLGPAGQPGQPVPGEGAEDATRRSSSRCGRPTPTRAAWRASTSS